MVSWFGKPRCELGSGIAAIGPDAHAHHSRNGRSERIPNPSGIEVVMKPWTNPRVRTWTARQIAIDRDLDPVVTEDLKYAIERHLYHYGKQYRNGWDGDAATEARLVEAVGALERIVKETTLLEADPRWVDNALQPFSGKNVLFNGAYVNRGIGREAHPRSFSGALEAAGWVVLPLPWNDPAPATEGLSRIGRIAKLLDASLAGSFHILLNRDYQNLVAQVETLFEALFAHPVLKGVIVGSAEPVLERISLRLFDKLGKFAILTHHGKPCSATPEILGPARHILAWGEAEARAYLESGVAADRVVVVGHPYLDRLPGALASADLSRCLVLSRAQNGAGIGNLHVFQNRGEMVQYLDEIERVLKGLGVRKARLRPHPSESPEWYRLHADPGFYEIDEEPLDTSLARSGVVIGPTSTVLLDAHVAGKSYVVYEPAHLVHADDLGIPLMPPFDGSVPEIPFAASVEELETLLSRPLKAGTSFWSEHVVVPFRPEPLLALLGGSPTLGGPTDSSGGLARAEARMLPPPTADEMAIVEAAKPYTMTPHARIHALVRLVDHVEAEGIEGDFVECGVWKGGSSMAAAMRFLHHGDTSRDFFLYDTYDGMSAPTDDDVSPDGKRAAELLETNAKDKQNHIWAFSPLDDVRRHMQSTRYPSMRVRYVQGKVEDSIPGVIPRRIALLRLDTDWYESTLHELEHLYPLLASGGVLLLDDYGFWQGARKAVDEFFARMADPPRLHTIRDGVDDSAHWCIKP